MRSTYVISIGLVAALALVSCGGDEPSAGPASTGPEGSTVVTTSTTVAGTVPGRGWIGGEPAWSGSPTDGDMVAAMAEGDMASAESMVEEPASEPGSRVAPGDEPAGGSPLRAGSVDDNADFQAYLDYLERIRSLGIALRPFDPTGRILVSVRGSDGRPMAGATVDVTIDGSTIASVVTTADGSARFLPALYGQPADVSFTFATGGVSTDAAAGGRAELTIDGPGGTDSTVALDVLSLLDDTGPMGDEIDRIKATLLSTTERVRALDRPVDLRVGAVLYRDRGDDYVTRTLPLSGDVEGFDRALAVDHAIDIVVGILPGSAPGEHRVLNAHDHRVVAVLSIDGRTIQPFIRAGEELGDVHELSIGLRDRQRVTVLPFESGHFIRIFEQVLAVRPAIGVALGGVSPVGARSRRVFAIVLQRRFRDRIRQIVIIEEVCHF